MRFYILYFYTEGQSETWFFIVFLQVWNVLLLPGNSPECGLLNYLISGRFFREFWSGRPGSNRRRPAWEAGILPLNYARAELFLQG